MAVAPELRLTVLGTIVLVRTFLNYSLQLEVTGYLPWQGAKARQERQLPSAAGGD